MLIPLYTHDTYVIILRTCSQLTERAACLLGFRFNKGALLTLATTTMCVVSTVHAAEVDPTLRADLQRISQKKIFFGHQSVGRNLLDGVRQLSEMAGVPVNVVETPTARSVNPSTFGHVRVARNREPLQKLKSFEQAMGQQPTDLDMALVKFCYVDINAETDAKSLFARYRSTIEELKSKNPGTAFVHITAPLTVVEGGFKGWLKRLFGRAPYGAIENLRREEYNSLLREAYKGRDPLFDLARVESMAPDGTTQSVEWKGSFAPAMVPVYTDDGEHLNVVGQLRAARELVSVLAAIPDKPAVRARAR